MFREKVVDLSLTGFFCNEEIGPAGGSTFLHGYTSSFGIFRSKVGDGDLKAQESQGVPTCDGRLFLRRQGGSLYLSQH